MTGRYFDTGNPDVDAILISLDHSSDNHQVTDNREGLQLWLEGVIGRLQKLPEPTRSEMNVWKFQIGDQHFRCRPEHVEEISRRLVQELRTQLDAVYKGSPRA